MGEQVSWILWQIMPGDSGGTNFWICELKLFTKDFYSHKFVKAGLCYEVGVCIQTGLIVWINGPFVVSDITIFQSKMIYELLDWEMVKVDQGYVGQSNKIHMKYEQIHMKYELGVSENQFEAKTKARARGEMINGRFKNFCILTIDIGIKSQCTAMCFMLLLF